MTLVRRRITHPQRRRHPKSVGGRRPAQPAPDRAGVDAEHGRGDTGCPGATGGTYEEASIGRHPAGSTIRTPPGPPASSREPDMRPSQRRTAALTILAVLLAASACSPATTPPSGSSSPPPPTRPAATASPATPASPPAPAPAAGTYRNLRIGFIPAPGARPVRPPVTVTLVVRADGSQTRTTWQTASDPPARGFACHLSLPPGRHRMQALDLRRARPGDLRTRPAACASTTTAR
jgi:hypothetical protein